MRHVIKNMFKHNNLDNNMELIVDCIIFYILIRLQIMLAHYDARHINTRNQDLEMEV